MMKKKFLALLLSGVMALSLAACGGSQDDAVSDDNTDDTTADGKTYTVGIHPATAARGAGRRHRRLSGCPEGAVG